ncbi:MAG: hypothetical protein ACOCW2_02895 [Chitinivibrionales bacterium]
MRNVFKTILILVFMQSLAAGETSRLNRILSLYEGHVYQTNTRAVVCRGGFSKDSDDPAIDSSFGLIDTLLYFSRVYGATIAYEQQASRGGESSDFSQMITATLSYFSQNDGFSLKGRIESDEHSSFSLGQRFDRRDTIGQNIVLCGGVQQNRIWYSSWINDYIPSLFSQVNGRISLAGAYRKEENTEPPLEDSLVDGKYVVRNLSASTLVEVEPGIGFGRRVNVSPVFLALELERELKRIGAINFSLSDQTIAEIAKLLAASRSYRMRDRIVFNAFKKKLDTIISSDMAAEHENFRLLGPFAVQRIILRNTPLYFTRPQFRLYLREQLLIRGEQLSIRYPYEDIDFESERISRFPHHLELNTSFDWGVALSEQIFLSTAFQKRLLTGDEGPVFYDGSMDWSSLSTYDVSIGLSWWPFLWFQTSVGIDRFPLKGLVPADIPQRLYLVSSLFIEDNITISFDLSFIRRNTLSLSRFVDCRLNMQEGFGFSLSAFYGF